MQNRIFIDKNPYEYRVAVMEEDKLVELYVERKGSERIAGNIYKGIVKNVLPGMQAAFVDIGLERNAFLYAGDINIENDELCIDESLPVPDIRSLVRVGQEKIIQVLKEPFGTKGARVTTNITLPGRTIVLMPNADYIGISRRIEDEKERARLKDILQQVRPDGMGVIARTVAKGASFEEIKEEFDYLNNLYKTILDNYSKAAAPSLIHSDANIIFRAIRDLLSNDTEYVQINDAEVYEYALKITQMLSPHHLDKIKLFQQHFDMFDYYGIEAKIDRALRRKVWLKSGGYLVFDTVEALTVIDVNTGKYTGKEDLQQTILNTNIEAAKEIATQIRLRDISGIIVVDFIDLEDPQDRETLLKVLREATKRDRTRTTILGMTDLGIVEMTRKKVRQSLSSVYYGICPYCAGEGVILSTESMALKARKEVIHLFNQTPYKIALIKAHPSVINEIKAKTTKEKQLIPKLPGKRVYLLACDNMHIEHIECEGAYEPDKLLEDGAEALEIWN